jgi:MoxR-like ATPase
VTNEPDRQPQAGDPPDVSPADHFRASAESIEQQVSAVIVGQREAIRGVLTALVLSGHALLEGVPGLGKTRLAQTFAASLGLSHNRIQFTPDLMPADITGTVVLRESAGHAPQLAFEPGPLFANLVLADEVNRASPRTQSALLEAMQEGTVTMGGETHPLPRPFSVLATQNPIDMQGTYPLPEAQLDRFLLKVFFSYPSVDELTAIVRRTASEGEAPRPSFDAEHLLAMGALARSLPVSTGVLDYASRLVVALQPSPEARPLVRDYVRLGPSPRGAQALTSAGSVAALLAGRNHLSYEDVRSVALPALRHRIILTFDAERRGIAADEIVSTVVDDLSEDAG